MTGDESRRALITGVAGFAGRHLARLLTSEGWTVAGTVRSRRADVPGVWQHVVDIGDVAGLTALVADFRPHVVYHLAAVVDTVTTPDVVELQRTNVLGTAALLEAVRGSLETRRVLLASSSFAYGPTPPDQQPVPESAPLRPVTPYGSSKAASEAVALAFSRETGVEVVVTRAFQHTGPGHVGRYALADWAAQLTSGARSLAVGNLDAARDYLDVRDVAAAYYAVAEQGQSGEVYNVASGVPRTMRSLLEGLVQAFGSDAEITVDPSRLRGHDQPTFYGDIDRLTTHTSWKPVYPIERTLQDLAQWYLAQRPDYAVARRETD